MAKITAVIDIGSNSARMAIFEKTSRYGFRLIYENKSRVRISEGCYENDGYLQEIPIRRAISALREFSAIAKRHNARKLLCVATSAVRDAPNRAEFLQRARKESGVQVKIIDGEREAWYGGIACANLSHKKSGITIDIGGGSTECAIIENGDVREVISLRLGTIRLKELFFDHKNLDAAKDFIKQELRKIPVHFSHDNVFGIGGTIRALAKMHSKQHKYPIKTIHGYEMPSKSIKSFIQTIYKTKEESLASLGVPQDRRDTIRSGALIFSMLLEHFGAHTITTSGVGVREGVFLADMLRTQKYRFPTGIYPSFVALKDRFGVVDKWGKLIAKEARAIFDVLSSVHALPESGKHYLTIAAQLCEVGGFLNFYGRMDHGAYVLLHGLDYGFSHTDRAILCLLLEYLNKRIPQDDAIAHITDIMPPIQYLQWLSFILSLAYSLCLTGGSKLEYSYENGTLFITANTALTLARESVEKFIAPTHVLITFLESRG